MNKCIYWPDTTCPRTRDSCHSCPNRPQDGSLTKRAAIEASERIMSEIREQQNERY